MFFFFWPKNHLLSLWKLNQSGWQRVFPFVKRDEWIDGLISFGDSNFLTWSTDTKSSKGSPYSRGKVTVWAYKEGVSRVCDEKFDNLIDVQIIQGNFFQIITKSGFFVVNFVDGKLVKKDFISTIEGEQDFLKEAPLRFKKGIALVSNIPLKKSVTIYQENNSFSRWCGENPKVEYVDDNNNIALINDSGVYKVLHIHQAEKKK